MNKTFALLFGCLLAGTAYAAPSPGEMAPDFHATNLDGESVELAEFRGKPVMLYFFVSWCVWYVKDSNPEMSQICDESNQRIIDTQNSFIDDLVIIGIGSRYSTDEEGTRKFRDRLELKFPIIFDQSNEIFRAYKVRNFPTSVVIDAEGKIADYRYGTPNDIPALINSLHD